VGLGAGARFRGVGSGSCRLGSVGGSGPGASGSVELREKAGSAGTGRERGSGGPERGGSAVPGRSRSERGSGVRTGGGGTLRQPCLFRVPTCPLLQ
jgi:hypothetical protein